MADKITCPFNAVHVVDRHKLVNHMTRCITTFKGGSHTPMHCPLDYSHIVEAGKMNEHLLKCPQLALAVPLLSADLNSGGGGPVTGNLKLPPQPSCINELVSGEWDADDSASGAAASPSFADFSDAGVDDGKSDMASSYMSLPAGGGLGRGRGAGRGSVRPPAGQPAVGTALPSSSDCDFAPGDFVPGGYTLKYLYYPPGFGPRGRFEIRGSI